jgi:3-oxoacyl-(acyl-carrier-protein) synthase
MADRRWRIAITGIGLVTPLGLTASENMRRVLRGESGIPAHSPGDEGTAAAVVQPFEITNFLRQPKNLKLMSRPVRMALMATREAADQSGALSSGIAPERVGVFAGSGQTGIEYDEFFKALTIAWEQGREQDFKYLGGMPTRVLDRYFSLRTLANAGVGAISTEFGARGPSNNYVQGETAPAVAISEACHHLMEERCDAAIVCGYDCLLVPSMAMAFRKMNLLSGGGLDSGYFPFREGRPGMVLGEGAACFILERRGDALSRAAAVLAEIDGVGLASQPSDEEGLTAPAEDIRAAALEALGSVEPGLVIARGLGTEADDLAEARALASFVPPGAMVTALKGYTGYLGAASAAVELGIGLLCARDGWAPAIYGGATTDPRIRLNLVEGQPAALSGPETTGLFLSSTFGGQVAAIAARPAACQRGHHE